MAQVQTQTDADRRCSLCRCVSDSGIRIDGGDDLSCFVVVVVVSWDYFHVVVARTLPSSCLVRTFSLIFSQLTEVDRALCGSTRNAYRQSSCHDMITVTGCGTLTSH